MTAINTNPRYQHDCDECTFLGTIASTYQPDAPYTDLYYCKPQNTLLARYSSRGSDYSSLPLACVGISTAINTDLKEAGKRAGVA